MQDIFQDINKQARELLVPKTYLSWQTLILLSAFSLLVAGLLEYIAAPDLEASDILLIRILTTLSWTFFTVAIWWWLSTLKNLKIYGFSIYPWLVGVVLCCFFFRPWRSEDRLQLAVSSWPMISVGVMALPQFIGWDLERKTLSDNAKKSLITTSLVNLLLTSWMLFHFMVQAWVLDYPSLLLNGVDDSYFVYDFAVEREDPSQGGVLLERMADDIEREITDLPWYQAERWLYTRAPRLEVIFQNSLDALDAPTEDVFWQLDVAEPRQVDEAYWLDLRANWTGPTVRDREFYLEKSCKIFPVNRLRPVASEEDEPPPTARIAQVDCGEDVPAEKYLKPL